MSTLAGISLPGPPVEIVIALSVALLGAEAIYLRRGRQTLSARYPWLIAFGFGLIHGFGFAGALADIGLPERAELLALLLFNLGVELGQIGVVALLFGLFWLLKRISKRGWTFAQYAAAYGIGIAGMYWTIERLIGTYLV